MKNHRTASRMILLLASGISALLPLAGIRANAGSPMFNREINWPAAAASDLSDKLTKQGDALAAKGDWNVAAAAYGQAVREYPTNGLALYGLSQCAAQKGDVASEISYMRAAFFSPDGSTLHECRYYKLMQYAIALNDTGQKAEAYRVYDFAANSLNQIPGGLPLPLPLPVYGPGNMPQCDAEFDAMANIGAGVDNLNYDKVAARGHLTAAQKLYFTGGMAEFYLGRSYTFSDEPNAETKALQYFKIAVDNGNYVVLGKVREEVERCGPEFVQKAQSVLPLK